MNVIAPQTSTVDQVDDDLKRLEMGIRQLKIQYDRYFNGGIKRPPHVMQARVVKIIKRYSEEAIPKYHQRFLFQSLVSRYNIFAELWGRRVRVAEEGPVRRTPPPPAGGNEEQVLGRCLIDDVDQASPGLTELHRGFVEARRSEGAAEISLERFLEGVRTQLARVNEKAAQGQLELRLVRADGKVGLRARVRKPRS